MTVKPHRSLVVPLPPPPLTSSITVNIVAVKFVAANNHSHCQTPDPWQLTNMSTPASRIDQADRPSQESGRIELPSIPRVSEVASRSTPPMPAVVRGAYQVGRNIYHYPQPGILANQTNAAVMSGVRTTFRTAQAEASTWGFLLSQRVFRKLLVEEASISVVGSRQCNISPSSLLSLKSPRSYSPALTRKGASRPPASSHINPFYDPS
jgi:hypothetical protein